MQQKLGCKMGGIQMNNFSDADDMVILAPSMKASETLFQLASYMQ